MLALHPQTTHVLKKGRLPSDHCVHSPVNNVVAVDVHQGLQKRLDHLASYEALSQSLPAHTRQHCTQSGQGSDTRACAHTDRQMGTGRACPFVPLPPPPHLRVLICTSGPCCSTHLNRPQYATTHARLAEESVPPKQQGGGREEGRVRATPKSLR